MSNPTLFLIQASRPVISYISLLHLYLSNNHNIFEAMLVAFNIHFDIKRTPNTINRVMDDHNYYRTNNCNNNNNGNTDISTLIHGEDIEFSNQELEGTMDIILDDLLRDTHAHNNHHTNNLHPEMLSSPNNEEKTSENDESTQVINNKRARTDKGDNKEAVRRYRDKLKDREVALQEEITKLKASNQELSKRLQNETAMQDEIYMLKCLLVDIRSRIEGEIHSFRHFRPASISGGYKNNGVHHQQCNNNEQRSRIAGKRLQSGQMLYDDCGQHGSINTPVFDNFNRRTPTLPSLPNKFFTFKGDV